MLHHLSLAVTDLARSAAFYDATLLPLGYIRVWADDTAMGYGPPGSDDKFAIKLRKNIDVPGDGFHVAFTAPSLEAMHAFYEAALAHGGKDNGGAALHSEYGPHYYAAFVFDPDGYRIEATIQEKAKSVDFHGLRAFRNTFVTLLRRVWNCVTIMQVTCL